MTSRRIGTALVLTGCGIIAVSSTVLALAARTAADISFSVVKVEGGAADELRSIGALGTTPIDIMAGTIIDAAAHTDSNGTALALLADFVAPRLAYVTVEEGMRVEQVAQRVGKELGWEHWERDAFVGISQACTEEIREGTIDPGTYAVSPDADPAEVRSVMKDSFDARVDELVTQSGSPLSVRDAIIVASLIQREAAGAHDMNLISGIIWNRIFLGMSLDIDATLQYAKVDQIAEQGKEVTTWWPIVRSKDKFIDSPYNTYLNDGFPPSPIATPSEEAILAALNPEETECLFYLHDPKRRIHCAKDYAEHKRNVARYLR